MRYTLLALLTLAPWACDAAIRVPHAKREPSHQQATVTLRQTQAQDIPDVEAGRRLGDDLGAALVARNDSLTQGVWLAVGQGHRKAYGNAFMIKKYDYHATPQFIDIANSLASPSKDIYQFGVYTGGSMVGMAKKLKSYGMQWGFDSFEGLPEEAKGVSTQGWHWRPGAFSAADAMHAHSYEKLTAQILAKFPKERRAQANFVRGYFKESLVPALLKQYRFQPALVVDIDVDLYTSAMDCLSWMILNGLLVPGSLVRYDDWNHDVNWGETRAHAELTQQFGLEWRNITRNGGYAEFQLTACLRCANRGSHADR